MEIHPGVFVSSVSTEEFEPDPEVGGEVHILCSADGVESGMSRISAAPGAPVVYTTPARETVIVLEGEARIEIEGGPTLELTAGSLASIPAGAVTTWHVTAPFKEFWVLA
jgi:quercetin dioxygenase-like cupin family protein